jgi:periplasmic protein TonB
VVLKLVIDKTGKVADITVMQSVFPSLDSEAMRVVRSLPAWQPALKDGKPVNSYYTLPFTVGLK